MANDDTTESIINDLLNSRAKYCMLRRNLEDDEGYTTDEELDHFYLLTILQIEDDLVRYGYTG